MEERLSGKRERSLQARISVQGFGRQNLMAYWVSGLSLVVAIAAGFAIGSSAVNSLLLMALPVIVVIIMKPWVGLLLLLLVGLAGKFGESPDFPIDAMQALGFLTVGSALLYFMTKKLRYRSSPMDGPIVLLVVAMVVTLPGSDLETYFPQILSLLTILGLYIASVQLMDAQYKVHVALSTFVISCAVVVVVCIIFLIAQKAEFSLAGRSVLLFYSDKYDNIRVGGPFEQPNAFAQLTAIAVPTGLAMMLSTRRLHRWLLGVVTALNATGTFLTQSRSAIWGIMFGVAFLLYLTQQTKRLRQYATLALVSLGLIISVSITGLGEKILQRLKPETTVLETEDAEKYTGRTLTFRAAIESFFEHPWGAGYGQSGHLIGKQLSVEARASHNVFLTWMVEFGIPGLIAALWLLFRQIRMLWQVTRHPLNSEWRMLATGCLGAVTATWIHNMFHSTLHWGLVWLFFAMASSVAMLGRQHRERTTSGNHRQPMQQARCGQE